MPENHRIGRVEVRPAERALLIDGKPVELGSRAFDLLFALISHRDHVMTKDELLDMVWPGLVVEENNLQVQVSALRKVLGPQAIATVPGRGYQFVAADQAVFWNIDQAAKVDVTSPPVVAGIANAPVLSIVVLPFTNLTGDANQAYVADGLTVSMTADLSRIRDAFIVDTATAFTYKDKPATAQQVGKDLGVRFVLQGSVLRSGTKIRINAQLADTTSNAQLWTDTFEGDQSDLFALYDKVTGRIGNSIGQEMIIIAGRESETRKSNPQAADLILRARAANLKPLSLKNYQHIETLFREALALDPNNSRAMIGVASALAQQAVSFSGAFDERAGERKFAEAHDLALRVKELDPNNPNIYFVLGVYALKVDDFDGARRAWETYFSLMPKSGYAYNNLAVSYIDGGEPIRAIELLTQAISLQPGGPGASQMSNLCEAHFMLGDNDGAIQWCLKSLARNPELARTHAFLAMAYSLKGDDAKARVAVASLRKLPLGHGLTDEFKRPVSSQPAAYKEWYEGKFLPVALKLGLWEKQ